MARKTTHIRVSPEQRDVLADLKEQIFENPADKSYGDVIAVLAGFYAGRNGF